MSDDYGGGIWKYANYLPHVPSDRRVTIGEGHTPLVRSRHIGKELGLSRLYFKLESANPTGSYKDRIAAVGVSRALVAGQAGLIGTSSGNAGAAFAAYAAAAGLPYELFVLERIVPAKLAQAVAFGAKVKRIRGLGQSTDVSLRLGDHVHERAERMNYAVAITAFAFNPPAMAGVKTIAYELFEQMGNTMPEAVFAPAGSGGLFVGLAQGFEDLGVERFIERLPCPVIVQSAGCCNIVEAWRQGLDAPVQQDSTSQISGLQVPGAFDGTAALAFVRRRHGWGESVPDAETWNWQRRLAELEGILCEPAAAITLAGVARSVQAGRLSADTSVVCIISGAGYKDMASVQTIVDSKPDVPLCSVEQLEVRG